MLTAQFTEMRTYTHLLFYRSIAQPYHVSIHTCTWLYMYISIITTVETYCLLWVTLQNCPDVAAVHDEKVLHKLKVSKIVVGLVVQEFQVLFVHNTLHGLGNGGRCLQCLCEGRE